MEVYRKMLHEQGFPQHPSRNKLRDVSNELAEEGHLFSLNKVTCMSTDNFGYILLMTLL